MDCVAGALPRHKPQQGNHHLLATVVALGDCFFTGACLAVVPVAGHDAFAVLAVAGQVSMVVSVELLFDGQQEEAAASLVAAALHASPPAWAEIKATPKKADKISIFIGL